MDPVHPDPAPDPGTAEAQVTRRSTTTALADNPGAERSAAGSNDAGSNTDHTGHGHGPASMRTAASRPAPAVRTAAPEGERLASRLGTPAVYKHRIVAIEAARGVRPLTLCMQDGDLAMMPLEAQVWARAGRLTVVGAEGEEYKLTVLGPEEAAGARIGDHWPRGESDSAARRAASAAVQDVGKALTFPAWLARTTRISGQRNVALHGLVKRLRQASPGTAVYYGQTFGFEHHPPDRRPHDQRGIVGREGYPTEP